MADDESMAYMDLKDIRDELQEETAVEELRELLKFMQDELKERIEDHAQDVRKLGPAKRGSTQSNRRASRKMKSYKLKLTH